MRSLALALLLLVAGCPGGRAAIDGRPRAGQRWTFRMGGLPGAEQVYEVTDVQAAAVRFRVHTLAGGEPIGEPLEQTFPRVPGPAPLESGAQGAPLVLGALRLETWITVEGEERRTFAVDGRTPVFPGVVRVERGEQVLVELTGVREP